MIQRLIVLLLCLLLFTSSYGQIKNDLSNKNLKGKVKETINNTYRAITLSEEIQKGEFLETYIYTYNEKGYETKFGAGLYQNISRYDKDGYKIQYSLMQDSIMLQNILMKNDSKGLKVREDIFNARNNLLGQRRYKYDANGNRIELREFNGLGDILFMKKFNYDERRNKTKEVKQDSSKQILSNYAFLYDDKDNLTYETGFTYKPSVSYSESKHIYNSNGDVIQSLIYYGPTRILLTYKYEYDDEKNWIKKIEFEEGMPSRIEERQIRYYK